MTLTQKETMLVQDMKAQERLCIEKYGKYAKAACDGQLKAIFEQLESNEQKHLDTLEQILAGSEVRMPAASPSAEAAKTSCTPSSCSADGKAQDVYMCKDALAMEKHVSSVYNTCVFEFISPVLRDTLAHIQKEEQNHGEMLYGYLACNNAYS